MDGFNKKQFKENFYKLLDGMFELERCLRLEIYKEDWILILKEMGCECEETIKEIIEDMGWNNDEDNKEENI